MIHVLAKSAAVLGLVSRHEPCSLSYLVGVSGIKKPTLYVILQSLAELGFLSKTAESEYRLGPKLMELAQPRREDAVLRAIAEGTAARLSEELHESVCVARVRRGERETIAQATHRQTVMVDASLSNVAAFYRNATGRVLLAFLDKRTVRKAFEREERPEDDWAHVSSPEELQAELETIRETGIAFKTSPDSQAVFAAVPAFGPGRKIQAAIGVSVPASRFKSSHRKKILERLKATGDRMSQELTAALE